MVLIRCVLYAEVGNDFIKETVCVGSKSRNFLDRCARPVLQPADFYLYTEFQQTEFAEDTAQRADFIAVAAVYGETAVSEDNSINHNSGVK